MQGEAFAPLSRGIPRGFGGLSRRGDKMSEAPNDWMIRGVQQNTRSLDCVRRIASLSDALRSR